MRIPALSLLVGALLNGTGALAQSTHPTDPARERWRDISPEAVNAGASLPLGFDGDEGPSVLAVQILLNRSFFSPGMLDGRWGNNSRQAVLHFQRKHALEPTGMVDSATYALLHDAARNPEALVAEHTLSAADVRGPFAPLPRSMYEQARLPCTCFESLGEKLTELFHSRRDLLAKLNPGVALDSVGAGTKLLVPQVRQMADGAGAQVAEILVSGSGNFVQAKDARGRVLFHFASTLGSSIDPSPEGEVTVRGVERDPWWHYQPALLKALRSDAPAAMIPPGPNNSVGRVWMALSVPHYGIHGTGSPETIGYAVSSGCVRLTNWDAVFLARHVRPGMRVRFENTRDGQRVIPRRPRPRLLGVPADSARRDTMPVQARPR